MLDFLFVAQQKVKTKLTQRGESNFSLYINLCVNNLSQFTFGLFGAQVRFFLEYNRIKNYTNEYPNIFVSENHYTNMIQTNIHIGKYLNIFEYPNIRHILI